MIFYTKMKFSNKFIFYSIVLLFIIIVPLLITLFKKKENFATFGYADIKDEYMIPSIYDNMVTEKEANYILEYSKDKFEESTIVGGDNNNIRKSQTCWISKNNEIVKNIILRICSIGNYPFENVEDLQVVKYGPNGYYKEHHDTCCEDDQPSREFLSRGGHRVATMLIYLNDDFEGGATRFVNLGQDIKPNKYGSILFHPLDITQTKCHHYALHAGLPITSGEKYIANVWIRETEFS